jgi:hypothetical protein
MKLVAAIARGRRWLGELITDLATDAEAIAKHERCSLRHVNMTLSLAFIAALNPRKSNPRTHSKKQIDQLARAITQFGFTNPVLIDDGNGIIAGHGRVVWLRQRTLKERLCSPLGFRSAGQSRAWGPSRLRRACCRRGG